MSGGMLLLNFYYLGAAATLLAVVWLFLILFFPRSRGRFGRRPYLFLLLALFVAVFWLAPWGSALGHIGGKMDAPHRLILKRAPYPGVHPRERFVFSRILQDRYGISCPPVNGCLVFSRHDREFEQSYDAVMREAITRRYGRDVVAECEQATRDETGT